MTATVAERVWHAPHRSRLREHVEPAHKKLAQAREQYGLLSSLAANAPAAEAPLWKGAAMVVYLYVYVYLYLYLCS